jgi:hypothetical protein
MSGSGAGGEGCWGGDGSAGCLGEGRHAQVDGGGLAGDELVHLGELGGRGGEADFESFGFAGPVVLLGLGDAVLQVVANVGQAGPLGRVGPQEGAADTALLVDAAGSVSAAAVAERDPAALEVAEEFFPFGVSGGAVFVAGAQGAAAGDECPVTVDDLFGVDGLVPGEERFSMAAAPASSRAGVNS